MISHDRKFIFIHIPKTAGTSLTARLRDHGIVLGGERNARSIYFRHATLQFIADSLGDEFENYFSFGVLRNPWDWCVSNYLFNRGMHKPYRVGTIYDVDDYTKGKGWNVPAEIMAMEFSAWLPWWLKTMRPRMLGMLMSRDGEILADEIFQVEQIEAAHDRICERLGLETAAPVPFVNRTRARGAAGYAQYYTDEIRDLVGSYFADTIALKGYRFEDGVS